MTLRVIIANNKGLDLQYLINRYNVRLIKRFKSSDFQIYIDVQI